MPLLSRCLFLIAGVSLMIAAALSAYGFHGLPGKVPDARLASWAWATQFQFFHSFGLIIVGLLLQHAPGSLLLRAAAALFLAGLVLFSGSIYAEVLGAPQTIGGVAPLGGSSFMLGWLLLGIAGFRTGAGGRA
ncbi:MAG: hypothetical protein AMXMBFR8_23530 [Nevskiales bacterium]